jgi:hypothetical protein
MSEEFNKNIERIKENFYAKQKKNVFFTKNQKLELANTISTSMNIEDLIKQTVYVIENTNRVYMDYTFFKMYANPAIYDIFVSYIMLLINSRIEKYGSFETHINLNTFTISACHRYKEVIEAFLNQCLKHQTAISMKLTKLYIYYTPSVFDSIQKILSPLIDELVKQKIELITKEESPTKLSLLLS